MPAGLVLGLGEVLWDCFPDEERPGGAPANFAYHAAQLGFDGGVLSRVGSDERGQKLLTWLREKGVLTDWIQHDPIHPTGIVTVDISEPQHPRFTIHENVAWDFMELTEAWKSATQSALAICFGTLAQRSPVSRSTIHSLLRMVKGEQIVIYDINLRQHYYDRETIENSLRLANWVKLNEEEGKVLRELLEISTADDREFCQAIHDRYNVEAVCITRGENGCLVWDRTGYATSPGLQVTVVDTVGAGDAFTAGWLAARLQGWDLHRQAEFANRVGALVASRAGAMPPMREEYYSLWQQFGGTI